MFKCVVCRTQFAMIGELEEVIKRWSNRPKKAELRSPLVDVIIGILINISTQNKE